MTIYSPFNERRVMMKDYYQKSMRCKASSAMAFFFSKFSPPVRGLKDEDHKYPNKSGDDPYFLPIVWLLTGRRTVKRLPLPKVLSTLIRPPMESKSPFTMGSPRPVPVMYLVLSSLTRKNLSKIFSRYLSAIPNPLSLTLTRTLIPAISTATFISPPSWV